MLKNNRDFSKPIETMKATMVLTPQSSVKSSTNSTTNPTMESSETKDNFHYFPGCRKDANCSCEICIASINATLDLMPLSIQRSSLTKLSASKPPPRTPIPFNPSTLSTPKSSANTKSSFTMSPPQDSTLKMGFCEKAKRKKRDLGCGFMMMRMVLYFAAVLGLEFGFSWMVFGILQPKLSVDVVRHLGEKSRGLKDLNERIVFLKNELQDLVSKDVPGCSSLDSTWKINQDGLLLNSRCVLYKSMAEEVSIWGWPMQTAGLLTADFSSRSFTILSGRVTEWFNGHVGYMIRRGSSSWTQGKWSASAVQLDPKTWILEYRESSITENARLISALLEFLKFSLARELGKMKQEFWMLSAFGSQQHTQLTRGSFRVPT